MHGILVEYVIILVFEDKDSILTKSISRLQNIPDSYRG